jgi:hypothetical protein
MDPNQPLPLWLNPSYAKHIVTGKFTTLSDKPKTVEEGEWIAHQGKPQPMQPFITGPNVCLVVEHYRLLWHFVRIVIEKEDDGTAICNCTRMSAGR